MSLSKVRLAMIALASAGERNRIAASSKYSRPSSHAVAMKNAMFGGMMLGSIVIVEKIMMKMQKKQEL